ncbi:MAG: gamma-glutamyltransferase [Planctomycetota bacterium]|nr:gamma-glutamyltransferase [Planctomycetota bacterium]
MKVSHSEEGMVVAAHALAAEAGRDVLQEGGNSVDAAIAVSLALGVVEPQASGLGGGGFMMISPEGDLDRTIVIDGRGKTPSLAEETYIYPEGVFLPWAPKTGPMSATIPGLGRMLSYAMKTYGSGISLSRLVAPARQHAIHGFEVGKVFAYCSALFEASLRNSPAAARIYYRDGQRVPLGEKVVQTDLAGTLDRIASEGFEILYSGELAEAITQAMNESGPVWGKSDLSDYEIRVRKPLWEEIAGVRLATTGPPSRGGVGMVHALQALKGVSLDLAERSLFLLKEVERIFCAMTPIIGDPDLLEMDLDLSGSGSAPPSGGGTSHFTIIDRSGTIVTMSQTIGHFFGSTVMVPGTGILLNNDISDMERSPGLPNSIGPSKRPVANMAPTILFSEGRTIALGSPGSLRIFPALTCVLDRLLYHKMGLEEAIRAPRVHWEEGRAFVEGDFSSETFDQIAQKFSGPVVKRRVQDLFFGGVHAVERTASKALLGVADPRRDGVAVGL